MALFSVSDVNTTYISRYDVNHPFSSYSEHGFELEERYWPTVEHYYQAMKFANTEYQEKIRNAETAEIANKLGHARIQKRVKDWKKNRMLMMTRAIYTKCRTHSNLTEQLLDTGDDMLMETSQYDYYWGCGRDRLGENNYGKILINIRKKLSEEKKEDI